MLQKGKQLRSMQKDISKLTQTRATVERRETPVTRVVSFRLARFAIDGLRKERTLVI